MTYNNVLIVGCGKMGEMWANSFFNSGCNITGIIDPDPRDEKFYYNVESELYSSLDECRDVASSSDVWVIATPTSEHFDYGKEAIRMDIPMVLIEKPCTSNPEKTKELMELSENRETNICVDYIEMEHQVVSKVLDDLDNDFRLTQAVHWRGKEAPRVIPFVMDDMVHDFSEILAMYSRIGRDFSEISLDRISEMYSWSESDRELPSDLENIYDVKANLHLSGESNEIMTIKGGFDQERERRYFCWVDDYKETSYFVSTLRREEVNVEDILDNSKSRDVHRNTFATKINGTENISKLIHYLIEGELVTMDDFNQILDVLDAEILISPDMREKDPDETISSKILDGETSPASVEQAYEIESLVKDIYESNDDFKDIYKI